MEKINELDIIYIYGLGSINKGDIKYAVLTVIFFIIFSIVFFKMFGNIYSKAKNKKDSGNTNNISNSKFIYGGSLNISTRNILSVAGLVLLSVAVLLGFSFLLADTPFSFLKYIAAFSMIGAAVCSIVLLLNSSTVFYEEINENGSGVSS